LKHTSALPTRRPVTSPANMYRALRQAAPDMKPGTQSLNSPAAASCSAYVQCVCRKNVHAHRMHNVQNEAQCVTPVKSTEHAAQHMLSSHCMQPQLVSACSSCRSCAACCWLDASYLRRACAAQRNAMMCTEGACHASTIKQPCNYRNHMLQNRYFAASVLLNVQQGCTLPLVLVLATGPNH
jgi:hypothetical protein